MNVLSSQSTAADIGTFRRPASPLPVSLPAAVMSTIAYNDLFGYAPRPHEIRRYLHGWAADAVRASAAIDDLVLSGKLITDGERVALSGRGHLFRQTLVRRQRAADLWPSARRYAALLASIPTVRMVAVTGSLAVGNTEPDADIDFMLIVDGGTLWRTRALVKFAETVDHRMRRRLCVNFMLSERALDLRDKGLYVAHELAQMVPLYGLDTYQAFRAANSWVDVYLPNASDAPQESGTVTPFPGLRMAGSPLMKSMLARRIEAWECKRKLERYNDTDFLPGRFSIFTREALGHRLHVRDQIESLHEQRQSEPVAARHFRVLFGQSYHLYFDRKLWNEMRPYPPLGSLYGAAIARSKGFDVRFFDAMLATGISDWRLALDRHSPGVVILYEDNFNYLTKMCLLRMRDAAVQMISAARVTGASIVVAGSDASDNAAIYLQAGADYVIRGEGEQVLSALLTQFRRGEVTPAAIPGISYRGDDGEIVNNPRPPVLRNLDDLPAPAWDLVDLEKYRTIWRRSHGRFSINMVTTRGCPYHCNWCSKPIWGQRYNCRSPENVVDELAGLVERIAPDHVWFMDDIFGLKPGWIRRFAECLRSRNIRIRFKCLTRPDLLNRPGEIEALASAGCDVVWMGAESGSQDILDAMEKGTEVHDIEATSLALRDHGIRVGHFIQFGYPGESLEDIRKTIAMIRRVLPDELGVSVSYPLPGTQFFERVKLQLGGKRNWQDSEDLAMLYRGPYSTRFYRGLHRYVHRSLSWHRVRRQLSNGELFKLPLRTQLRRTASFGLGSLALPATWTWLLLLSVWSRTRFESLRPPLDRSAAASPSEQE